MQILFSEKIVLQFGILIGKLIFQVKSKRDVNRVTKSECGPDKTEAIRSKRADPPVLGAPSDTKQSEAEQIKQLVTTALAQLSEKPDSRKYG